MRDQADEAEGLIPCVAEAMALITGDKYDTTRLERDVLACFIAHTALSSEDEHLMLPPMGVIGGRLPRTYVEDSHGEMRCSIFLGQ